MIREKSALILLPFFGGLSTALMCITFYRRLRDLKYITSDLDFFAGVITMLLVIIVVSILSPIIENKTIKE